MWAPKRMVAPLISIPRCSGIKSMTGIGGFRVDFGAVRIFQAADVPCILDDGKLEPVADAQEGDVVFPCKLDSRNLAFRAAWSKAVGYEDAVEVGEVFYALWVMLKFFCFKVADADFGFACAAAVPKRLSHAYVTVG